MFSTVCTVLIHFKPSVLLNPPSLILSYVIFYLSKKLEDLLIILVLSQYITQYQQHHPFVSARRCQWGLSSETSEALYQLQQTKTAINTHLSYRPSSDLPTSQITKVYFAAPKSDFSHKKCILQVRPQKMLVIQLSNTQTNTTDVPGKLNLFYKSPPPLPLPPKKKLVLSQSACRRHLKLVDC